MPPLQQVLDRAVSPVCGCARLQLRFERPSGELIEAAGACPLALDYLSRLGPWDSSPARPEALIDGQPAELSAALNRASQLLLAAQAPLVRGLAGLTVEALIPAIQLAERLAAPVVVTPADQTQPIMADEDPAWGPQILAGRDALRADQCELILWNIPTEGDCPHWLPQSGGARSITTVTTATPAEDMAWAVGLAAALREMAIAAEPRARQLAHRIRQQPRTHLVLGSRVAHDPGIGAVLQAAAARCWPKLTIGKLPAGDNRRGASEVLAWQLGARGNALIPLGDAGAERAASSETFFANTACERVTWVGLPDSEAELTGDLLLQLGDTPDFVPSPRTPTIHLGRELQADAQVSFRIPGLDPRLRGTVIREDGGPLLLCGDPEQGIPDPAVALLETLLTSCQREAR